PYYTLLHDAPNPEHTSMVFRELMMGHLLGWGNFYGQIIWDNRGQAVEINGEFELRDQVPR
ncbi:MAG: phage portal protein, partial [Burkholderiales bacterium]